MSGRREDALARFRQRLSAAAEAALDVLELGDGAAQDAALVALATNVALHDGPRELLAAYRRAIVGAREERAASAAQSPSPRPPLAKAKVLDLRPRLEARRRSGDEGA